ncbi:hypothetical protein CCACVL1_24468 [Corchorus capsularis]|uniref:F-box domain-containing protein n=1 Tax=Corchorus capsularis TaxID=210143 RepID=A0A1R3GPN7_COCAP|nr:hypothetical protein CCACVL1_24468 [Corchorus capsularis]
MELQRPKLSDNNHNRFSDLPESVILHIFSFMDTIDVVRASAVATNWSLAKNISWDKNPSFLQATTIFTWVWDDDFVPNEEFADHVLKILGGVCHAEVLNLGMCILKYVYPAVAKPECFTRFYNLKALAVSIGIVECYILPLIYLMKCAPNLERLSMLIDEYEKPTSDYILEIPDEAIECHLKRVKLIDVGYDYDNELKLIRFFLENGHVLEEMSIISKNRLEPESKREYIEEVMRFPRSSSYVTVTFSEPKRAGWDELDSSTHSPSASLLHLQNCNNSNDGSPLRRSPLFRTQMMAPAPPPSFISNGNARRLLLDPAIHEEFTRLKNLVEEKDKKVKELQENIAAVSFTPQSKIGKMLMAKCRTLQEENEEIGTQAEEGKIHELAMKLALQKSQNAELRSQFEALYNQMEGLTNDVERSNETVYILQEKLEERENEIKRLKLELQQKTQVKEDEMVTDVDVAIDTSKVKDEMVTDETENSEQIE